MKKDLLQAYKQAPWRTQIQRVGAFLLVVIAIAAVSGLYLFISGRSAATGRRIQNLESEAAALHRQNNDLETLLGKIQSDQAATAHTSGSALPGSARLYPRWWFQPGTAANDC